MSLLHISMPLSQLLIASSEIIEIHANFMVIMNLFLTTLIGRFGTTELLDLWTIGPILRLHYKSNLQPSQILALCCILGRLCSVAKPGNQVKI